LRLTRITPLLVLVLLACVLALPAGAAAKDDGPDDLVVITGGATVEAGETVGDVFVVDGDVTVDGNVEGSLVAVAGDIRLSGTVEDDLVTVAGRAVLSQDASVGGDLSYGDEKPIAPPGTVDGEITNENLDDISAGPWAVITTVALWIAMTLSLLVLGLCLVAIMPRVAEAAAAASRTSLWESIAIGIGTWVALVFIGFFALFTLVGIPFGLILLSAAIPAAALGYIAASFALGRRVTGSASPILAFLAGFGILRALALIPFLGALVSLIAATVGIGLLVVAASRAGAGRRGDGVAARAPKRAAAAAPAAKKPAAKSAARKPAAKKRAAKKRAAKKSPARRPRRS
jgi:hypothetical protein